MRGAVDGEGNGAEDGITDEIGGRTGEGSVLRLRIGSRKGKDETRKLRKGNGCGE